MFHRITPRIPGVDRLYRSRWGTVQIGQPINVDPGGDPETRGATVTIVASAAAFSSGQPRSIYAVSPNIASNSFGPKIIAGTNANDASLIVLNAANTIGYFKLVGDGSGFLGYNGTINTLSWTAAGAGTWATPTSAVVALTVNGAASSLVAIFSGANSTSAYTQWSVAGSRVGFVGASSSLVVGGAATDFSLTALNNLDIGVNSGSTTAIRIVSAGNVTINPPTAAPHLTLAESATSPINTIVLGSGVNGRGSAIKFLGASAAQGKNWLIGNQNNLSDTLEFTPSTASGGSTFTTPVLKLQGGGTVLIASAGTNIFQVSGLVSPVIQGYGPTQAALVDMTPDFGTATVTLTGVTTTVTGSAFWARMGNLAAAIIPAMTGASNSTACTITGLPAVIAPAHTFSMALPPAVLENNTVVSSNTNNIYASFATAASSTITLNWGSALGFTAAGTKGVAAAFILVWHIQ